MFFSVRVVGIAVSNQCGTIMVTLRQRVKPGEGQEKTWPRALTLETQALRVRVAEEA